MITTIIVFILVIGLLIFVHEFGHFILAKRAGIRVDEFGFGFPPRIFGIKKGETIYSLNLLPIGGFVKIYGEDGPKGAETDKKRAFYSQPLTARFKILAAGVAMNLLLAAFLLAIGYWIGLPTIIGDEESGNLKEAKVQITQVAFNSPAEEAGIKIGDSIKQLAVNNDVVAVNTAKEVQEFIDVHQGQEVMVTVQRGDEVLEKTLVPRISPPAGEGPLGIGLARTAIVSYPWYEALFKGAVSMIYLTGAIIVALGGVLWQLITTGQLAVQIAGPVGIFSLTGQAAQLGFIYILQFAAILSINLAILNGLPFPALDGGRLLFLAIEKIKGSPVSQRVEKFAHTAGFVALILLMIAITWRDVVRFF
jgi:regulator of sigma E protease